MYYGLEIELLIYAAIIGFAVSLIILIADKIKKRNISTLFRHVTTALFIIYLLFLLSVTLFFRGKINAEYIRVELIPFKSLIYNLKNKLYSNLTEQIYNILVFVPFGFLISGAIPERRVIPIIVGLITTVSIEILQYLTGRGVFDISDIIYNLIGTLIGYGVYRLFRYVCKKIAERKNENVI